MRPYLEGGDQLIRKERVYQAYNDLGTIKNFYPAPLVVDPIDPEGFTQIPHWPSSLAVAAGSFFDRVRQEAMRYDGHNFDDLERQVEILIGVPTGGKSWARRRYEAIAEDEAETMPRATV